MLGFRLCCKMVSEIWGIEPYVGESIKARVRLYGQMIKLLLLINLHIDNAHDQLLVWASYLKSYYACSNPFNDQII